MTSPLTSNARAMNQLRIKGMKGSRAAEQIPKLTPEQRIALIEVLWDSLEEHELPITPAQAAELDRRMATFEQDAAEAQPWDVVGSALSAVCLEPGCCPHGSGEARRLPCGMNVNRQA